MSYLRGVLLTLCFVSAFAAPVFLVRSFYQQDETVHIEEDARALLTVPRTGAFIRIGSQPSLLPSGKNDYLISFWVRIDSLPAVEEKYFFFAHFDAAHPYQPGVAFGLERSQAGFRPLAHWRDREGGGGLYRFAETAVRPGQWHMAFLLFSPERQVLSAQILPAEQLTEISSTRAGALKVDNVAIPALVSDDFVYGSMRGNGFVGALGNLAIIEGKDLSRNKGAISSALLVNKQLHSISSEKGLDLILNLEKMADEEFSDTAHQERKISVVQNRKQRNTKDRTTN